MTLDKSASLSPEQLRVAVAERLGWKWARYTLHSDPDYRLWKTIPNHAWILETPATKPTAKVALENTPNYPESRDACATFEATLTDEQQDEYAHHLSQLVPQRLNCGPVTDDGPDIMVHREFDLINAKAELRCRAFLAVSGNRNE